MYLSQLANLPRQETNSMKQYYLIYCRKSTESEEKQLQSIDDQRDILTTLAREKGLTTLQIFEEEKSAKAPGRPIFNQMIELIKSRKDIKGILAWKLNRLSRNPIDSGELQWLIQSKVIEEIVTPSKTYLDADSDFIMSIEGAQANKFIRDLREDTIRGINSKIEKGWKPGLAPVGYRNTTEKPKGMREIVPHDVYFPLVKELMSLALTGQYTLEGLGFEAQRLGIMSQGKIRHKNNVWKILTNPFYAGRFLYKGQLYLGKHERMISDQEFDQIQQYLTSRAKPRNKAYPISGFIKCGACGYQITGSTRKKNYKSGKTADFVYYRCSQHVNDKCDQPPIPADDLENQVSDFLSTIKLSPKLVKWALKELNKGSKTQLQTKQAKIVALTKNLDTVRKKLENLFTMKIDPENKDESMITDDEYKGMKQKLLIEKEDIQQELLKTDNLTDDWMKVAVNVFNFASKALDKWKNGTIEEKRVILHAIGINLVLKDKILEITPRSMFQEIQKANELASKGSIIEGSVRREGFAPSKGNPPDLQSGAIDYSATSGYIAYYTQFLLYYLYG